MKYFIVWKVTQTPIKIRLKFTRENIAIFVAQGAGAAVCPQYRTETVRQVRAGSVPGNSQRAAEQTKVLGQTHREGPRLLQEDARLVL